MGDAAYSRDRLLAALACLQPGIDPVFLVLLSSHSGLLPEQHAWVVGASQLGMALGALLYWRIGARLKRSSALCAGALMLALGIATLAASGLGPTMTLRGGYGLCAGFIYTRATSAATAGRATHAFGTIFLIQLVLSTASAALLPMLALATSPGAAIAALALCPAAILLLLLLEDGARTDAPDDTRRVARGVGRIGGPALAAATTMFLFICATMMVWSCAGAAGTAMGLSNGQIGLAVSIGSFCGVIPAFIAAHLPARVSAPLTAAICTLTMLTPLIALAGAFGMPGFLTGICLFNIGSTFAIIRFSGLAVAQEDREEVRRCVAALHPAGMVAGPFIAAAAMQVGGFAALGIATFGFLALASALLLPVSGETAELGEGVLQ